MQNVDEDLSWMSGKICQSIEIGSDTFTTFAFSHGVRLVAECPWRFVVDGHIRVGSFDHGALFGRSKRVDAQDEVMKIIKSQPIAEVSCSHGLPDLSLNFGSAGELQIVPFSAGYEGWSLWGPNGLRLIAVGGGELVVFPATSEGP